MSWEVLTIGPQKEIPNPCLQFRWDSNVVAFKLLFFQCHQLLIDQLNQVNVRTRRVIITTQKPRPSTPC